MRCATEALCAYFYVHDREILKKSLTYFGVILVFALGAGMGNYVTVRFGGGAIWICCGLLFVSFTMMFVNGEN